MNIKNRLDLIKFLFTHGNVMSGLSKKSIGYLGWTGHKNLGDEAMFYSFKQLFPKQHVYPYNYLKEYPRLENRVRPKNLRAITLGGGTLINSKGSFQNFEEVFHYHPDTPIFTFGTGVKNPHFWNSVQSWENELQDWIKYLKRCDYVSVRGPLSKKLLSEKGFTNAEIIGDIALSLANDEIIPKTHNKKIAINIGSGSGKIWGNEDQFIKDMKKVVIKLLEQDWHVTLFSVWEKDTENLKSLSEMIDRPISIFPAYKSISKAFDFLSKQDVVIGEKLHSVILAHCVHTPAIMLEYRPKCLDYMLSMGMEKFNIRTNEISYRVIINLLEELYSKTNLIQKQLKGKIDFYKQLQLKAAENIQKLLRL